MRFVLLILLSSCTLFFGSHGPESAKGDHYKVEFTSSDWKQKKDNRSDYVFENKKDGRILLSNSFCDEFQDRPLEDLAHKTFRSVGNFKPARGRYTTLQDREAYRLEGIGKVDGVAVELHLLNTRRNNCYFDFVSIAPVKQTTDRITDFEKFLSSVIFK